MEKHPKTIDPRRVGSYPAFAKSGAGYFYDAVLEYRVWCHPEKGAPDEYEGGDYYYAFDSYAKALLFSQATTGAEQPLALVRQDQWIDEPESGVFIPHRSKRITEWRVEWLLQSKRRPGSISAFLKTRRTRT